MPKKKAIPIVKSHPEQLDALLREFLLEHVARGETQCGTLFIERVNGT